MAVHRASVDAAMAGMRLDVFLARHFPAIIQETGISRSGIQRMIVEGLVTLNGAKTKSSARLRANDLVEIRSLDAKPVALVAEPLPLDIVFEDADCIVVNKAPGMVVHPASGRTQGTLVNALLHHCRDLKGVGGERRPGIVHRLDKDTSGVMVIAKNDLAYQRLARQFKERAIDKQYVAVVWGKMGADHGVIDRPIGRHRSDRKRMSSLHSLSKAREAATEWSVKACFTVGDGRTPVYVSVLSLKPVTGRTHQIRVHLSDSGHPIVGDPVYGRKRAPSGESREIQLLNSFPRQALHAERLGLHHPRSGERMNFCAPLWPDIARLVEALASRTTVAAAARG